MATRRRPGYLRVIEGGLSQRPGAVRTIPLSSQTVVRLVPEDDFAECTTADIERKILAIWEKGSSEQKYQFYGAVSRVFNSLGKEGRV